MPGPDRSRGRSELSIDVLVDAPQKAVWDTVVDWGTQADWVPATTVRVADGSPAHGLGARLVAVTGVGRVAFEDPMVVTEWEPPYRCVVRHTGRLVRGEGVFEVFALPGERSRFVWTERLDLPAGALGRLGWPLVRPAFAAGGRLALRRLARRFGTGA